MTIPPFLPVAVLLAATDEEELEPPFCARVSCFANFADAVFAASASALLVRGETKEGGGPAPSGGFGGMIWSLTYTTFPFI